MASDGLGDDKARGNKANKNMAQGDGK
jgi:hypothetical protein